jgi:hypothetical protein
LFHFTRPTERFAVAFRARRYTVSDVRIAFVNLTDALRRLGYSDVDSWKLQEGISTNGVPYNIEYRGHLVGARRSMDIGKTAKEAVRSIEAMTDGITLGLEVQDAKAENNKQA